ncbi:MAG: C1 family peptidase, partial [Treponema sp.]|nr:C1 family peptidase [Treponema sp.]
MRSVKWILLTLVLGAASLYSQESPRYPRGAILDEESYRSLPRKAVLATRAYEGLPGVFSLKQYAPQPGDQADYGTCVAWAAAYGARTISESVALDRKNRDQTTRNAFSPAYIYRSIRPDDPAGRQGAQIYWALDMMKDSGAVKMLDIERTVEFPRLDLSIYSESKKYPIAGYVTLFSREERGKPALVVRMVKKSLVEGKPVIIGMNTPDSFIEADDVWRPVEDPDNYYGGHAMCVVGYDDERAGGAFEVINSWGRKWGNGGFMWIPYRSFIDFVMESYEMIEDLAVYSDTVKFAGFARVEVKSAAGFTPAPLRAVSPGVYRTAAAWPEGTEFRFITGSGESTYLYAFAVSQAAGGGAEDFFTPVLLFPQAGFSPLLNYSDNEVLIPGNDKTLALDSEPGLEHLVVLYAKRSLDIRALMRRFEDSRGSLENRLAKALGKDLLTGKLDYEEEKAAFTGETDDGKAVAALILAIDHR